MSVPSILVVEDNATARKLFRVALEAEGYRVLEAGDGRQALALARLNTLDLVLTDLVLPDLDGLSLAQELRALPYGNALPIVAVSGFRRLLDRACLEPDCFNDFLLKPVDLAQLLGIVAKFAPKPQPPQSKAGSTRPSVLVVDDDPVQLKLVRVRLELEGFKVSTSLDASSALEALPITLPDVVLCDVLMPGMDGYELCLAVRNDPALAHIPVVLVSAHFGGTRDQELARQVGASSMVLRTPDIQEIVDALRDAIGRVPVPALAREFPRAEHTERISAQLKRQARANAGWAERSALQAAQLTILTGIGRALAQSDDVEASFGDVLGTCLDTGGISRGALYRFDSRDQVVCTHSIGFGDQLAPGLPDCFGAPELLERARLGTVVAPSATMNESGLEGFLAAAGAKAAVLVPLLGIRTCMGALLLVSTSSEIDEHDLLAFGRAIATHVAQALGMATSMKRLQSASNASRLLSASLDLEETLAAFGRLATEQVSDVCEVHLGGEEPRLFGSGGVGAERLHGAGKARTVVATLLAHDRALGTVTMTRRPERREFHELDRLFAEDLTRRAAIAIDNALLYRAAQEASRLKDEFLATLSHELRTPLNAILGWSRLLLGGIDASRHQEGLRVIERNATAQALLIEDLLDVASMVSNKARLELSTVPLLQVVDAAVAAVRPSLEQKQQALELGHVDPELCVRADPNRLRQIVSNLLTNAVKFTPEKGKISLDVTREAKRVVLRVKDNGKGIERAFLSQVFERFKQADGSYTRAHGGLGLGLAITRHLTELHHGTISAHSDGLGCGSTFSLTLPLNGEKAAPTESGAPPTFSQSDAMLLRDIDILVVDDQEDSRELTAEVLRQCGARPTCAASTAEAYGAFLRSPPDLLLSDIGMPGEDGFALIQKVRALPEAAGGSIPALALSGYVQAEDRHRAVSAGYTRHLAKPVDPVELVSLIAELVQTQRGHARASRVATT